MITELLKNREIVLIARSSTDLQTFSVEAQEEAMRRTVEDAGGVLVDTIRLDGVSASNPTRIEAVYDGLIERRRTERDFDTALLYDTSRLSRRGTDHCGHLTWKLRSAGIQVVFQDSTGNEMVDGLLRSVSATTAQQQVAVGAMKIAAGMTLSLRDARMLPWNIPPFGVDRLVVDPDGREVALIRKLPGAPTEEVDPATGAVRKTYARRGYRKQKDDRYLAVPAGDWRRQIVIRMFGRRDVDGWGPHRICRELNALAVPSPTGVEWSVNTVRKILSNEAYVGYTWCNRTDSAEYANRDAVGGHRPVRRSEDERSASGRFSPRQRPRSEWFRYEHPLLAEYLPEDLREAARARIERERERASAPKPAAEATKRPKGRHLHSSFFLEGVARTPDGARLTGKTGGKDGRYRYYRHRRAMQCPGGNTSPKSIPAECLEEAVLDVMEEALLSAVDLRAEVAAAIEAEQDALREQAGSKPALEARLKDLDAQARMVLRQGGSMGDHWVDDEMVRIGGERRDVERELERLDAQAALLPDEVEGMTDELLAALSAAGGVLRSLDPAGLRSMAELLIDELVVDLATGEVSLTLSIPCAADERTWMFSGVGLGSTSVYRDVLQAHMPCGLQMGLWRWCIPPDCRKAVAAARATDDGALSVQDLDPYLDPSNVSLAA